MSFVWLSGCSGATFEKGLNYERLRDIALNMIKGRMAHLSQIKKMETILTLCLVEDLVGFMV